LALNNSKGASVNFVNRINEAFKIKGNLNYSQDNLRASSAFSTNYFNPNNVVIIDSNNERNKITNLSGELNSDYLINKKSRILASFNYNFKPSNYFSNSESNFNNISRDSITQLQNNNNQYFVGDLKYTLKLPNNTALLITGKYLDQNINLNYFTTSAINANNILFNGSNQLRQDAIQKNTTYELNLEGLKRRGNCFFELNTGFNINSKILKTDLNYFNSGGFERLGNDFINNNDYQNDKLYLNSKFIYDKNNFKLKAELKNSLQQLNIFSKDTTLLILEPSITSNWKLNQISNININYSFRNTTIEPFDFYQGNILTNTRNLTEGLNQFYNFGTHQSALNYNYNDFANNYITLNAQLSMGISNKGFITENFFENNFFVAKQLFYNGLKSYALNLNLKKFVPKISTSLSTGYNLNLRNYFNKVGNIINEYQNINQTFNFKGDTGFDFPVNFNIGFQYVKSRTQLANQTIAQNNSFKYSLIARWKLSEIILPLVNFEWARINQQDYRMLNTEIQINPKKGKFKYSLEGKNLLNLRSFDNFFIDDAQSARFSNQILGRYIAARIQFSIN
jgi:hypothetical protein